MSPSCFFCQGSYCACLKWLLFVIYSTNCSLCTSFPGESITAFHVNDPGLVCLLVFVFGRLANLFYLFFDIQRDFRNEKHFLSLPGTNRARHSAVLLFYCVTARCGEAFRGCKSLRRTGERICLLLRYFHNGVLRWGLWVFAWSLSISHSGKALQLANR